MDFPISAASAEGAARAGPSPSSLNDTIIVSADSNKNIRLSNPPPTLINLLQAYPVFDSLISNLDIDALYSLSQTCKDICFLLHQGGENVWMLLKDKAQPRVCDWKMKHPNRPGLCEGPVLKCLGCKENICFKGARPYPQLEEYVNDRLRTTCCKDCMQIGYTPYLANSTGTSFFNKHTLAQLTAGKVWANWSMERSEILRRALAREANALAPVAPMNGQTVQNGGLQQQHQQTPPMAQRGLHPYYRIPAELKKRSNSLPVRAGDPQQLDLYSIRTHQDSYCKCQDYIRYIPLCYHCVEKVAYSGFKYNAFTKSDPGVCECGSLLWAMDGFDGEVIKPNYLSDSDIIGKIKTDGDGDIIMNGIELIGQEYDINRPGKPKEKDQKWLGICNWCGFRVKKQNADVSVDATGANQSLQQAGGLQPHGEQSVSLQLEAIQQSLHQLNQLMRGPVNLQRQSQTQFAQGLPLGSEAGQQPAQPSAAQLQFHVLQPATHSQPQASPASIQTQIPASQAANFHVQQATLAQHYQEAADNNHQNQDGSADTDTDTDTDAEREEDEEYDDYEDYYGPEDEDWDNDEDVQAYALSGGLLQSNLPLTDGASSNASNSNSSASDNTAAPDSTGSD